MQKDTKKPQGNRSERELESARVGHQVAVHLHTAYSGGVWRVFSAMLVANSILIGGIIVIAVNMPESACLACLAAIAGLFICVAWGVIVQRAEGFGVYYLLSARELEKPAFEGQVETLERGAKLAEGAEVSLRIDAETNPRKHRLSGWARLRRGRWATKAVILTFVTVYALMLLWSVLLSRFSILAQVCSLLRAVWATP
jgi:hypothetical protein